MDKTPLMIDRQEIKTDMIITDVEDNVHQNFSEMSWALVDLIIMIVVSEKKKPSPVRYMF